MNYDLILSGGIIVDGSGNPWFKADVGIKDGKIAKIGKIPCSKADKHIDVAGLVLAPGFIDIHSHSDMILWTKPELDCKIRQGITTEVVGNCGSSAAPLYGEAYEEAEKFIENLPGGSEKKPFWSTISEYLQALKEQGVPVNVATLIGHSTVRTCVMGFRDDDPSRSEMNEMKELVDQGMKDGAFGLSTGLIYAPGCYAKTSELIALSKVVADHGGIYVSHVRNEGNKLLQSIWEAIEIGRKAGLPIHISHHKASGVMNWGKVRISLSLMEEVRREGIDVTCDVYPYTAGCSWCLSHILPRWISEGGVTEMIRRLKKRGVRERIRRQIEQGVDVSPLLELGEWDSIIIAAVKSEKNRNVEGMSLAEISRLKGMDPLDCIFDLIIDEEDEITGFFFTMCENDVQYVIKHRLSMVGTDAVPPRRRGLVHPRNYGTFPKVIRKYVNEMKIITLEEAIRKMTSAPAQRLGLHDRGLLRENFWADIVVFNLRAIRDEATYKNPYKYPSGIEFVLVNGVIVVDRGRFTGEMPGKILTKKT